ncbi:MAG: hypothetical protein HKO59_10785 [Phycisphaerales bacterium]|nr:hypothetical protein [Phycisphaerae bacterium]NNF42104.1 hypothetical protein [Phycisphaerales bacterium]NNM26449.1 hypothetical protein [Phycisphaerales bacterium]
MKKGIVSGVALLATSTFAHGQVVVIDNIGDPGGADLGGTSASQIFEDAFSIYNIAAIENFSLGAATTITTIEAMLSGFNGYGGLGGVIEYNVDIYSSEFAAEVSLTGDVFHAVFAAPSASESIEDGDGVDTFDTDLVSFDVSIDLGAGDYHVGISPRNDFGVNGQTGLRRTVGIGDGTGGYQANPSGAFGFTLQAIAAGEDYAYRVIAIPAPGAFALLGLAGVVSRRRRRA